MGDINRVKKAAKEYHEEIFNRAELFKAGSWLEKSDDQLISIVKKYFGDKKGVRALDLGCGVGRTVIPLAQIIKPNGGTVTAVDILDTAIKKLRANAQKYEVADIVDASVRDVDGYEIKPDTFDIIVAHSVLEQGLDGKEKFLNAINSTQAATRKSGVNYLGITTQLEELDAITLAQLPADIGFNTTPNEMEKLLSEQYKGWNILYTQRSPYEERYLKNGRMIIWRAIFVMFAAQKK